MFGREYLFVRPSFGESRAERAMRDTEPTRPLSKAVSFSVERKHSCFTGVLRLLHLSSPAAVVFFVVSVAVKPVDRSLWKRLQSHILKKVDKRIKPSLADRYALSAVEMIIIIVGIVASSLHFFPRRVFGRIAHTSGNCSVTSARLYRIISKITSSHSSRIPALASAQPSGITAFGISGKLKHRKFVVHVANFIRAMLTASAGLNCFIAQCSTTNDCLHTAFTAAVPISPRKCLKLAASVSKNGKLAVFIAGFVFNAIWQLDRITRRHSSTLYKLDCDRAESVHHDCLGSFHFSTN